MDSIRENRTKEDILEEIRLERSEDIRNEKCFVIVEGSDDVLFAKKIFCENVICMESFAGKTGLQEILEEDEQESDDIIGIRDRDYVNERDLSQRIFLYDHCCLELMLLADRCISTSFHKIYYKGKSTCELFLINAMRQLSAYSILRKKNETEELGINFRNVRFGDLVDFASERLNDEELFLRAKEQERYVRCKQEADAVDDQIEEYALECIWRLDESELYEIIEEDVDCAELDYIDELRIIEYDVREEEDTEYIEGILEVSAYIDGYSIWKDEEEDEDIISGNGLYIMEMKFELSGCQGKYSDLELEQI